MCITDYSVLLWLHRHRQWPPEFPRRRTVLSPYEDEPKTPREEWGATEWRQYALFLEQSGVSLVRDLNRFERDLYEARKKLSRRKLKPQTGPQATLLTTVGLLSYQEKKARGRKPTNKREVIAAEVLAIRSELESRGNKRVTDKLALEEWLVRQGKRRSRAVENRNILNAVSEYRRNHNISRR